MRNFAGPTDKSGRDLFPNGLFILTVSHLASSTLPDATILRGLFDLTPAEAKIARLAAYGVAPKAIGALAGIKSNTAKAHLKSIYAKTGIDHHGALVRLLSGRHCLEGSLFTRATFEAWVPTMPEARSRQRQRQ